MTRSLTAFLVVTLAAISYEGRALGTGASASGGSEVERPAEIVLPPIETLPLAPGEQLLPIDLSTALRLAAAQNLEIREAQAHVAESRGVLEKSLGRMFPSLSASFTAQHTDGEIQASFGNLERHSFDTVNPLGAVTLDLNPGEAIFELLATRRLVGAEESGETNITEQTFASVAFKYLDLERALGRIGIAGSAVQAARELARLAETRESLGTGLEVDRFRAEARLAEEQGGLAAAGQEYRAASTELAVSLKLDPAVTLVPLDRKVRELVLPDVSRPTDELIASARKRHPEIHERELRLRAASDLRASAWWQALGPSTYGSFAESAIGKSFEVGNREIYGGFVGWKLSPGSVGDIKAADARLEQAGIQAERTARQVEAGVIRSRDKVRSARERVGAALRAVAAAEKAHALSQDRFGSGIALLLDVLDSQTALTRARAGALDAVVALNESEIGLLAAVGEPIREPLETWARENAEEGVTQMEEHRQWKHLVAFLPCFLAACGPSVAPQAVAWREREPVLTATAAAKRPGGLRVETDRDPKTIGDGPPFYVRRPYDVYSTDGQLVRRVDNEGSRWGEKPVVVSLPPGRYVIASVYGTVYRRLQVEVVTGGLTEVKEDQLEKGTPVFGQ